MLKKGLRRFIGILVQTLTFFLLFLPYNEALRKICRIVKKVRKSKKNCPSNKQNIELVQRIKKQTLIISINVQTQNDLVVTVVYSIGLL